MLEKWKQKKNKQNGKGQKTYKKQVFFGGGHPIMWKIKRKKGFLAKIAWHYLCQEGRKNAHFRAHYPLWPKILFGPKQCKPGKTIKIVVSAEIAQNHKWHLFFEKGGFLTWVKKWVLLTVFLKSCVFFFWKHYFKSVFSKTQLFKSKNCMLKKNRKFVKNCGLFWTWAKWCFGGLFFWGFDVIVVFGVFGIVPEMLKMLVLWGGLFFFTLGLEGLGVFVFLVLVFVFWCCLCFCLVCFVFVLLLDCFWCWFLFALVFCFFMFFVLGLLGGV